MVNLGELYVHLVFSHSCFHFSLYHGLLCMYRIGIMEKKKIKSRSAKNKGKRLQNIVAELISDLTGLPCGADEEVESRTMGQSGTDIRLSQRARELFQFSVECENSEKWHLSDKIKQAKSNTYLGTDWLVVLGRNHFKPVAILDLEVFFKLLRELKEAKEGK